MTDGSELLKMHCDRSHHCVDGSIYNLLRFSHPGLARRIRMHLADDSRKRISFLEIGEWLDENFPVLQVRKLATDDVLACIDDFASSGTPVLFLLAVEGNTHCIAADCGRKEYSDVASGAVVTIGTPDALSQLRISGFTEAMSLEFKRQKTAPKRKGKKLSAAEKKARHSVF